MQVVEKIVFGYRDTDNNVKQCICDLVILTNPRVNMIEAGHMRVRLMAAAMNCLVASACNTIKAVGDADACS
jgi:hypothetical protein